MTDLSPAAQVVLKEYEDSWTADPFEMDIGALAAALRAAADQLAHATSAHTLYAFADELEQFSDN